ncbi:MAG: uncharacterized protein KVP18_000050 [Porospora cf. gigantea A]|uniref:uncharacterized protein n=1 Tax=Porospora cf. gigantea A TaxID=2853593 RepID=UPI00355AC1F3|nr:MAG: hypothetical protein KVP18_000050 [Porospora cf. gigantea A]
MDLLPNIWGKDDTTGGFRVFDVKPGSVAEALRLEVFFDFVVSVEGNRFFHRWPDEAAQMKRFCSLINDAHTRAIKLQVYNILACDIRPVTVSLDEGETLGAVVGWVESKPLSGEAVRISKLISGSPAADAQLITNDVLLAYYPGIHDTKMTASAPFFALSGTAALVSLCHRHLDLPMEFLVYRPSTRSLKRVVVTPSLAWHGEGCLGAVFMPGLAPNMTLLPDPDVSAEESEMSDTSEESEFETESSSELPAPHWTPTELELPGGGCAQELQGPATLLPRLEVDGCRKPITPCVVMDEVSGTLPEDCSDDDRPDLSDSSAASTQVESTQADLGLLDVEGAAGLEAFKNLGVVPWLGLLNLPKTSRDIAAFTRAQAITQLQQPTSIVELANDADSSYPALESRTLYSVSRPAVLEK